MKNNNNSFLITLFILTISISLISSSTIIGNPVSVYSKESLSEKSSGADPSTNSTSNSNNSSLQQSATASHDCNNSQNKSACQEQHQLLLKQQPNQQQEQPKPDNSCLFHPEQMKCKPDPITGKCPKGFSMNVYEHCFPKIPCPKGFENHDEDETGTCYAILKPNTTRMPVSK
jgi:hypothetical protein